ncbi:predicted protein [Phaeodactylum tricornutum CCAP 1055/1]|jgi:acyl-CoA synthetase (AMP-forming)/AMP-acid ligase II|uniref:AMP-dependent synthetase/ligase domain-containing protein n=1 Tax=Phaeodactylum tricornutum (strain CCAP 1055/1) TaxID=556484 RepID=B7G440_PHATC|nr:predicted protein [Phaeodactylum tricornutum CCAP 1055/1]EEC46545.1 predicted protein [Phaeodactylum tricornutum CCAP 1055/1]|eukprot:XP_002182005.1 predicted protein [Phaeodactylum tricornutum CCAP 1055/1]
MSFKTIAAAVDAMASRVPLKLAVVSPFQTTATPLTYQGLRDQTRALASWLRGYGYEKGDLLVSDLPNIQENLVLQIACNRLGVGYATAKNAEGLAKFSKVKGALASTGGGVLAEANLSLPVLTGEFVLDLIQNGLDETVIEESVNDTLDESSTDESLGHGYYNTTTAYTNLQALSHGQEAAAVLHMTEYDVVCVAVTLCHPFGIGSGVCSALQSGASIVLPAVGGIQGCGVPSERAAATWQALRSESCTLLFADTHTLKALPMDSDTAATLRSLRGGVCKTGSGATFLDDIVMLDNVSLRTIGQPPETE